MMTPHTEQVRLPCRTGVLIVNLPLERGSSSCWGKRKTTKKQKTQTHKQGELPCSPGWLEGRPNDLPLNYRWSMGAPAANFIEPSRARSHCAAGWLIAIPSLERGSSSCWGKRKLAQKQEQAGLPLPRRKVGKRTFRPSMRARAALVTQSTGRVTVTDRGL